MTFWNTLHQVLECVTSNILTQKIVMTIWLDYFGMKSCREISLWWNIFWLLRNWKKYLKVFKTNRPRKCVIHKVWFLPSLPSILSYFELTVIGIFVSCFFVGFLGFFLSKGGNRVISFIRFKKSKKKISWIWCKLGGCGLFPWFCQSLG